jgi:hypothetical protein
MSEKATLLTSIPPVAKSTPAKKASLLTSVDQLPTVEKSSSLLTAAPQAKAVEVVASEAVAVEEAGQTITAFQGAIYVSFVLTFCLAGFAAVVLFRKASKIAEARFVMGAKSLGIASGLIALHGFFATYLYANYLNGEGAAPLFVTLALWALVGPAIAVVLNHLLTPESAPEKGAVVFDACAYFAIFTCSSIALIPSIKEDAALIFSLLGGFLFIVPVARSVGAFRKAKARHPELREASDQVLIYSLLFLPALLPILAFANVCKMSAELTLFLFNFITFDFVLLVGLSMIASADDLTPEAKSKESAVEAEQPATAAAQEVAPAVEQPQPAVVEFSAPKQPKSKKLPPRKPSKVASNSLPPAPRKPGASAASPEVAEATNAPSRVKAPAKPKKRF